MNDSRIKFTTQISTFSANTTSETSKEEFMVTGINQAQLLSILESQEKYALVDGMVLVHELNDDASHTFRIIPR